jgi:hypothetical protein
MVLGQSVTLGLGRTSLSDRTFEIDVLARDQYFEFLSAASKNATVAE